MVSLLHKSQFFYVASGVDISSPIDLGLLFLYMLLRPQVVLHYTCFGSTIELYYFRLQSSIYIAMTIHGDSGLLGTLTVQPIDKFVRSRIAFQLFRKVSENVMEPVPADTGLLEG